MSNFIFIRDIFYTIKIQQEISLNQEQKEKINEKELITDIKTCIIYAERPKYAKYVWENTDASSYPPGATIPMISLYDPMYGDGYIFDPGTGKFVDDNKYNTLYTVDIDNNFLINNCRIEFIIFVILIIIELIVSIVYVIGKKCNKKSN